jgi:hypothetical protein
VSTPCLFSIYIHDFKTYAKWIKSCFSEKLKPQEAFYAAQALLKLNSNTEPVEKWLIKNKNVLSTRFDKNEEAI